MIFMVIIHGSLMALIQSHFYLYPFINLFLLGRLQAKKIEICRFAPEYSQYTMLKHEQEVKSENRVAFLRNGSMRYNTDGLNSLDFKESEVKLHKLFTHVLAIT